MAPYISLTEQRRLRLRLVNIEMQRAIAELLGALDDKIATNKRLADTCEELALAFTASESVDLRRIPLAELVTQRRSTVSPETIHEPLVLHYSLPAFDAGRQPDRVPPLTIKSVKFRVSSPSVLLAKLNPATPRIWMMVPSSNAPSLASTEFLVLKPNDGVAMSDVWAICHQDGFLSALAGKASGTSNSHQRVKPADLLATEVSDPRAMDAAVRKQINGLTIRAENARAESNTLAELRDVLLPSLMTGDLRIKDAEKVVEGAAR